MPVEKTGLKLDEQRAQERQEGHHANAFTTVQFLSFAFFASLLPCSTAHRVPAVGLAAPPQ